MYEYLFATLLLIFLIGLVLVYYLSTSSYEGTYVDEHSKRPIVIVSGGGSTVLSDGDNRLPYRRSFGRHYFGRYRVKRRDGLMCLMDGSNCVMALRHDRRFSLKRHR